MRARWQIRKLGDICDFEGGSQPPKAEFIYEEAVGYVRFLQIRDFGSDKNITYVRNAKKNRLCKEDDILIGRYGASVGKILSGKAGAYNVALMKTIPNQEIIDRSWFHKFLISDDFQQPLLNVADRSAQAGFSKDDIYNFPVPIPPIPEQQRIVTLLDEAFDGIATAKVNAEKNLQNARAIFESHLQSVFTQRGNGWQVKKISEIAKHSLGKMLDKAKNKGIFQPYLRNLNVRWFVFDLSDVLQMPFQPEEFAKYTAIKGDVLICEGGYPGRAAIWDGDEPVYFQKALHRVRFHEAAHNKWFLYYLYAQDKSGALKQHFNGAGIQHFTGEALAKFELPFPPLPELLRAVAMFDDLSAETQRLESICQQKLAALDALKKSLLAQAFSGAL